MSGSSHPEAPSLVVAKTSVLASRTGMIAREDPLALLCDPVDRAVTLVEAPAGHGKTTLAAQWVERDQGRRFGWVGLSFAENDPVVLWRYIVAAIRSLVPGIAEPEWHRLNGPAPDITEVVTGLLNRLLAVEERLVIMLDDYQVIRNRSCHESVQFFIDHLPRSIQVTLISRTRPPLRLSRLATQGSVLEVDREDLLFTSDETLAVMRQVAGSVSANDGAAVHERTEGWPVAVYMAAVAWNSSNGVPARMAVPKAQVARYLMEEMLTQLADDERRFLRETSVLDRFDGDLCDYVTGGTGAAKRIADLADANLLLVPLDEHGEWYRYHHLLQDTLRSDLGRHDPELEARLNRRAMEWWLDYGDPSRAIHHAIDAGLSREAGDLICGYWTDYVFSGQIATAHRWLQRFPDHKLLEHPPALIAAAWVYAFRGDAVRTRTIARAAGRADYAGKMPDGTVSYESSTALMHCVLGLDGVRAALGDAQRAMALEPVTSKWYANIVSIVGTTLGALAEPGAVEALTESIARSNGIDGASTYALGQLAVLATWSDEWDKAAEFTSSGMDLIEEFNTHDLLSSGCVRAMAAGVAARNGDVGVARQRLRSMSTLLRSLSDAIPFDAMQIHLVMAEVYEQIGDPGAALVHARYAAARLASLGDAGVMKDRLGELLARLADDVTSDPLKADDLSSLTARERQILRLLSTSMSLREIGRELYISRNTAKTHVANIYRKLDVTTRTAAVVRAQELELV